jgi:hypothetical protein
LSIVQEKIEELISSGDLSSREKTSKIETIVGDISSLTELSEFLLFVSNNVDSIYRNREEKCDSDYLRNAASSLRGVAGGRELLAPLNITNDYAKTAWALYFAFAFE